MSIRDTIQYFLGKIVEWALSYEHIVFINYDSNGCPTCPAKKYNGDAGFDLFASKRTVITPYAVTEIPTGVFIDPRCPVWFEIQGRSSTLSKLKLQVATAVIDNGYRGELFIQVFEPKGETLVIEQYQRLAQIIPHRIIPIKFKYGILSKSDRGNNGFGSSGK